jgi:hypothetical protein
LANFNFETGPGPTITGPGGGFTPTIALINTIVPSGSTGVTYYSCNLCDGSCGGTDLVTAYAGQTLSIQFFMNNQSSECTFASMDNVCL